MTPNRTGEFQNTSCIAPEVKKENALSVTGMCKRARIIQTEQCQLKLLLWSLVDNFRRTGQ